jgi:hypothetical protein
MGDKSVVLELRADGRYYATFVNGEPVTDEKGAETQYEAAANFGADVHAPVPASAEQPPPTEPEAEAPAPKPEPAKKEK